MTKPFPSHSHWKVLDFWPPCSITFLGFPDSSVAKESACNARGPGLIPGSGRSSGEGIGYPLLYSQASLVAQLVKDLLAMWETWVRSLGSIRWRRERLPSPVFWPGEFDGLYSPWGRRELVTTERLSLLNHHNPSLGFRRNYSTRWPGQGHSCFLTKSQVCVCVCVCVCVSAGVCWVVGAGGLPGT